MESPRGSGRQAVGLRNGELAGRGQRKGLPCGRRTWRRSCQEPKVFLAPGSPRNMELEGKICSGKVSVHTQDSRVNVCKDTLESADESRAPMVMSAPVLVWDDP